MLFGPAKIEFFDEIYLKSNRYLYLVKVGFLWYIHSIHQLILELGNVFCKDLFY